MTDDTTADTTADTADPAPGPRPIRWGIASTGKIAAAMCEALSTLPDAEVVAVGSRTQAAADEFAERFGIPLAHGSHRALCADDGVDVVYVASPHSEHRAMTIEALDAGRHVLCEKAFARNAAEARDMVDAARRNERFLMEAMWSWFMPAWHDLRERIAAGAIGNVVLVDANFGIRIIDEHGRHRRPDLAGGALLDLGIYPLAFARFLLGEPTDLDRDLAVVGRRTDRGVDAAVAGSVRFPGGALATFSTTIDAQSDLTARVVGTEGTVVVDARFWHPVRYTINRADGSPPERVERPHRGLAHEAEHVMARVRAGELESDVVPLAATLANMELLDEIRRRIGVVYPGEA